MTAAGRSPIQMFCLIFGAVLLIVGVVGFAASSTFHVGSHPPGSDLIVFKVNGWHNIVHILSGLFLIGMSRTPDLARTGALAFGGIYLLVTIYGFIDGNDVIGLIPVDSEDNVLHLVLAGASLAAGFALPREVRGPSRVSTAR